MRTLYRLALALFLLSAGAFLVLDPFTAEDLATWSAGCALLAAAAAARLRFLDEDAAVRGEA